MAWKINANYLSTLKSVVKKIETPSPDTVCLFFEGTGPEEVLSLLSLPLAAPLIKSGHRCYYNGAFSVVDRALLHHSSGQRIEFVPVQTADEKFRFLRDWPGIRVFMEVQMQPKLFDRLSEENLQFRTIPDRGSYRTAFLYSRKQMEKESIGCLRRAMHDVEWPFSSSAVARRFLPPSFFGTAAPLVPGSREKKSTSGVLRHEMQIATSLMYKDKQVESFFQNWFSQCGLSVKLEYFPKPKLEQRFLNGELKHDMLFTSVGVTYPDPSPSLANYFGERLSSPQSRGIYPLETHELAQLSPLKNDIDKLTRWEALLAESRQIIPVGHFTAYTIVVGDSKMTSCLPKLSAASTALPLECLLR